MENKSNANENQIILQIHTILQELEIQHYTIVEEQKESVELYFVKKALDMRRRNHVTDIKLTVYRDFEQDSKKMRGSSIASVYVTMSYEEMKTAIQNAYYAASFVQNPYYELPSGESSECITMSSKLLEHTIDENAMLFAKALYEPDTSENVFINSAEFFSKLSHVRIVNSQGIDVSYQKGSISGEFITQCIAPTDVETFQDFSYNDLDLEALKALSASALETTKARALANTLPKTGTYNVILSNAQIESLFTYFTDRATADYIYLGYSDYKMGCNVQGDSASVEGLNIRFKATVPYSNEGVPMADRQFIENGKLKTIQGNSRLAYYLNLPATGIYDCIQVENGSVTMDEMKKEPYLHIMNFSDFTADTLTGSFGGEIRLAFYFDGKTVTPVTGGSISANMNDYLDQLVFSKERQIRAGFEGPKAILLKDVQLSGC